MKNFNLKTFVKSFSLTEKVILGLLFVVFLISGLIFLYNLNQKFLIEVPQRGGSLTEGVIGTPRLINPLLAVSETDKALTNIIYSGLLRSTSDGLAPDLAEKYEVSEDGLRYHFYLKDDIEFHDGTDVTSDDIIFTILSAQNPELRSPKRSNWEGVGIEKINDKEIVFTLEQPYPPFLQNMTLGILPKHIWSQISINEFSLSNINISPIGTGPYKVAKVKRDEIGIPSEYTLKYFNDFTLGKPFLDKIRFKFAKNQEELVEMYESGEVDSAYGVGPKVARSLQLEGKRIETFPLPRIFGLFMNQAEAPILSDNNIRKALRYATPKAKVVDDVLHGFGSIIDNPIPYYILEKETSNIQQDLQKAEQILLDAGWERNEDGIMVLETKDEKKILNLIITTSNIPELKESAEIVADSWRKIGAQVEIQNFTPSDLNSNVIRPRSFEVLLFGLVIGRDLDFYAFWHSSQRDDPGLNITGYANIDVDDSLESIRITEESEILSEELGFLREEIQKDIPAVFLYSPDFIYVVPEKLQGLGISNIISSEERFSKVYEWYVDTDKVWEFFVEE